MGTKQDNKTGIERDDKAAIKWNNKAGKGWDNAGVRDHRQDIKWASELAAGSRPGQDDHKVGVPGRDNKKLLSLQRRPI